MHNNNNTEYTMLQYKNATFQINTKRLKIVAKWQNFLLGGLWYYQKPQNNYKVAYVVDNIKT